MGKRTCKYIQKTVTIDFEIICYNRSLQVSLDSRCEKQAIAIMQERYDRWVEHEDEDVLGTCCEEYIIDGLEEADLKFTFSYRTNEDTE